MSDANTILKTDKTNNIYLFDNTFYNGVTAVVLDRNKDFNILNNYFYGFTTGIKTTRTPVADVRSLIKENYFENVKYAIYFDGDNHTKLDVLCNQFKHYTDFAILSNNTILKDQGDIIVGTANTFSSSSTQINHQFHHNGNSMKYYYDPSNPLSLTTGVGLTATAQVSSSDGSCVNASARLNTPSILKEQTLEGGDLAFSAFPNPFNQELTIIYSLPASCRKGSVTIYELASGKLVSFFDISANQNSITLSNISVSAGVYMCRLLLDDGSSKQIKLVNIK